MKPGAGRVRIGVLALQGDYALHVESLRRLGLSGKEVRRPGELPELDGLILPGGESTTMLKLMEGTDFWNALLEFHTRGGAFFGTCAGLILLARKVTGPRQQSLGVLDIDVTRNGYGRQVDSFESDIEIEGMGEPMRGVFIRAPRMVRTGPSVRVLARHMGEPILVESGRILAATFHPEATPDLRMHERFLERCTAKESVS